MTEPKQQSVMQFTFAHIDMPDDSWQWAIVTDYKGCQEYGEVLFAFDEDNLPNDAVVKIILEAIYFEYDTGNYKLKDLL